jgi:hypothetical protein
MVAVCLRVCGDIMEMWSGPDASESGRKEVVGRMRLWMSVDVVVR